MRHHTAGQRIPCRHEHRSEHRIAADIEQSFTVFHDLVVDETAIEWIILIRAPQLANAEITRVGDHSLERAAAADTRNDIEGLAIGREPDRLRQRLAILAAIAPPVEIDANGFTVEQW